jgi:hypothetical protein
MWSNLSYESLLSLESVNTQMELTSQLHCRTLSISHERVREWMEMAVNSDKELIVMTDIHDLKNKCFRKLNVLPTANSSF